MALVPSIPKWSSEPLTPQLLDRQQFLDTIGVRPLAPSALLRVAEHCFLKPYPPGWSEEVDPASGALYFFHAPTDKSLWTHPLETTFTEVLAFVQNAIGIAVVTLAERIEAHLHQAQQRATEQLEGWTGPHCGWTESNQYFYNTITQLSSWEDPREPWQYELHVRYDLLLGFLVEQEQVAADNDLHAQGTMSADLTKTVSTLASTISELSNSLDDSLSAHTKSLPSTTTPTQPQPKSMLNKMPLPPKVSAAGGAHVFSMPRYQQQYQQRVLQYRDGGGSPTASSKKIGATSASSCSSGKPPPPPADARPRGAQL